MTGIKMGLIELTLPAFAFLDDAQTGELKDRNVILHVRSQSVIEIFEPENAFFTEDTLTYRFTYTNLFGIKETLVAALHYCATLDAAIDRELIKKEVLRPAAQWYCEYARWEDENITREEDLG